MPDIVLEPVVDSLDKVAEPYRENYEERDGKYVFSKPVKIEDVGGLKGALEGERKTLKELREQLGKYKDLPADVQERLAKLTEHEQKEAERRGEYQTLLQKNTEKHQTEIKAKEDRITLLTNTITDVMSKSAITSEVEKVGGSVEGLMPHLLPHVVTIEDPNKPGQFNTVVVDPKDPTKERLGPKGQPMTLEELIAEKREHPVLSKLFDAKPASGSGGGTPRFGIGQPRMLKVSNDEAKDPAVYRRLKEQKQKGEIDGAVDERGVRIV
jgi:hypothetical protein